MLVQSLMKISGEYFKIVAYLPDDSVWRDDKSHKLGASQELSYLG